MKSEKTHREVKNPQISARYLADYMAASETVRRTIIQKCKYQATVRVIQHAEARTVSSKFIRSGETDTKFLHDEAQRLRDRLSADDFDRDVLDHNAEYIEQFARVVGGMDLPVAERLAVGQARDVDLNGVRVRPQLQFRLRRLTRTNKVRVGGGMLRYAKGKPVPPASASWQSAFLVGYIGMTVDETDAAQAELSLCLTLDAYAGISYPAPTDAVRRFQNMKAACASIAERWPNIAPPPKAVF